jgi:LysR family glycine cleavage system transcriptional activator
VRLFHRRNNSIALTEEGQRFRDDCAPAIAIIDRSVARIRKDTDAIVIHVSLSFGIRWLIPALEGFKRRHPSARVRIETAASPKTAPSETADISIRYERAGGEKGPGEIIATDLSLALLSPGLLRASGFSRTGRLADVPALKCAAGNWDWRLWAERLALPAQDITIAHEFDTDDAAIRAASAGLGMVLSPTLITAAELEAGTLVPLPGFPAVELGCYRLVTRPRPGRMVRDFADWLRAEISTSAAHNLLDLPPVAV